MGINSEVHDSAFTWAQSLCILSFPHPLFFLEDFKLWQCFHACPVTPHSQLLAPTLTLCGAAQGLHLPWLFLSAPCTGTVGDRESS